MSRLLKRAGFALTHPGAAVAYLRRLPRRLVAEDPGKLAKDAGEYWSDSRADDAVQDMSHWRGKGRWGDEAWYSVGRSHLSMVQELARACGCELAGGRFLEWGGGGGSNLLAFSEHYQRLYDVDISQANLEEVARQFEEHSKGGIHPIHIEPDDVGSVPGRVGEPLDLFLCTAVFQHFPSKAYGLEVLGCAAAMLKPGGLALIQIRYNDGSDQYVPKDRDYKSQFLTFTSYTIEEFWSACTGVGLQPVAIRLKPSVNYAYYGLIKHPAP